MTHPKAILATALILIATSVVVHAEESFRKEHPRRSEINRREREQRERIREGVKSGKITKEQAAQMRKDEAAIKAEERADVKANGGSLTKDQQQKLNQELNQESKKIYDEKHE